MAKKTIYLHNKVFGRLTVLGIDHLGPNGIYYWTAKCACDGKEVVVAQFHLLTGGTTSCGCVCKERSREASLTHGFSPSNPSTTKEQAQFYTVWHMMRQRCLNPKVKNYPNYGGRGITICNRWLESFENFRDDMWESFLEHGKIYGFGRNTSIDRWPNVNGNYEPSNCRWATKNEQEHHKRTSSITVDFVEHKYNKDKFRRYLLNCIIQSNDTPLFLERFGCTLIEFKKHIESLWLPGMNWNNHGKGPGKWQFDHIVGCNNFDLSKEENLKECFYYKNYQPMWDADHIKKSVRRLDCELSINN